ncbi:two-partner secretion domain-containing protein [Variovorax sp. LjRoot178]|uniref:two-partner secretion domain-containing protein n=1 Tax=Variovorax sp. LjRoot178 TaxID=3342277 RepID=UPI003ECF9FEF
MNKHLHRIVFSAARGMCMAVQETAMSAGKATGATSAVVATGLAGLLAVAPAPAQIVGAPGVAPNLRPTVLVAPNGVPLVNIQTPSAAGVSRNLFNQFDVQRNGVILNNSRTDVQTQLGGFVQGNPYLATGPARIILNEITSGNPTQLRGYVEVGGQRAEVIIANPAGISVDGGGFINASRATLTTGAPQFNAQGGLDSYVVRGGTISIDGAGLDLSRTDYAAILARAVQVNAGIWANELKVVTGANQVSADHGQISPTTGTGPTPTFALDVAQLGGMYAGKITLIGTEAGLGARNAGTIQAANGAGTLAGAGQLVVTAAGRLENIGTLQATAGANLNADSLANSGRIASGGELRIATQGTLGNAGGTLEGPRVELTSAGGDIDNRGGTIRQTSSVGLTVAGPSLSNTAGGVIGAEPVPETPAQPNPGTGTGGTGAGGTTDPGQPATGDGGGTGTDTGGSGGTAPSQPYVPPAPGSLTAAGAILNDGGHIYAGGPIALQTPQVNNNGGSLATTSLAASGPSFSNVGGTVNVANNFSANVDRFDNTGGSLRAGSLNIVATGDLINQDGKLESNGDASLSAGGSLDNTRGSVSAAGSLTANVAGAVNNTAGSLLANQGVTLNAQSLDNSKGSIQSATAGTRLTVTNQLQNAEGTIGAATDLSVQAGSLSSSGSLRGGNDTTIDVAGALINDGSITARRHTTLTAGSLQSTGVLGAGTQADGKYGSIGDLRVTSAGALVATGTQLAAGDAVLQGASIDLSSSITSTTSAANVALTATQGNITTSGATVVTPGTLSVTANAQPGQTLVNDAGILNAGQLDIRASNIANTHGGEIVQTGTGATAIATSGAIDNTHGRIATNGQDLSLSAATFTNTVGKIEHAGTGTLSIAGGSYSGANGQITGNGALVVNLAGAFNQDGGSTYAKQITIDAGALSNQGGQIVQAESGDTRISVVGALNNYAGTIASNGHTTVAAGSLSNQGGMIRAAETSNLGLTVGGMLDNSSKGELGAGGNTTLNAGSLNNSAEGRITAVGDLSSTTIAAISNQSGTIAANGNTTVNAASLNNNGGTVAAVGGKLQVTTSGATTNAGGSLQAGGATVLSNAGLDNSAGKVFGNSLSVDTHGQALTNALGTIAATTTINLQSGALNNNAGLIQSGGAMTVDTHGQALTNTNAAGYATGQGGITSAGTLTLDSGALNNNAGFIGAKDALVAHTGAVTNAAGGIVLGQSTVAIDTRGATYDNRGGQTLGVGDLSINTGAGAIDNTGALIRSSGTTTLNAGSIGNTATSGAEQGIEGRNVAIATASLTNAAGAIRADLNATLTSAGSIDNSAGGLISAGDTLSVVDPNAANPGAKTLAVKNTGSTLLAGKALAVDAGALTFDGKLLSKGDMRLALNQDVVIAAGSETIANRNLSLSTSGNITNSGRLAAGNELRLTGRNIDNTATGDIQGYITTLNASDTVTNRGIIDGVVTRINANTLTNIGTGRIYGDQVSIGAGTLNNLAETVNGVTSAATIAARGRLDIGAQTINNRDGALIFSDGDLVIGGSLDAAGRAIGAAATLNNNASTIEATRNADIKTAVLNNTNGGVSWTLQPGPSEHFVEYMTPGSSQRWKDSEVLFGFGGYIQFPDTGWNGWTAAAASNPIAPGSNANIRLLLPSPDYPLERFRSYYLQSPGNSADRSYQTCTGGDASVCETTAMPGAWYSRSDPIWATFGVAPPAEDLPADFIGRLHPDITVGQEGIWVSNGAEVAENVLVPFDHPVTQAEYDRWQAYRQAHTRLDEATLTFIHTVTGVVRGPDGDKPSRLYSIYDAFDYTVTTSTPVLQSSAPARILSGGAMSIQVGGGTNDMSQILAGGALSVTGGTIANVGLTVDAPTVQTGTAVHSYVKEHTFGSDERLYQFAPYNLTTNSTATLAAARQEGHVAIAGSGAGTGALTLGQTGAAAQGSGGVQSGSRVNPIVQVPSAVDGVVKTQGSTAGATGVAAGASGTAATRTVPMVVRTSTPNATLPTASLFATHPESTSRYLIETDPRFANYRNWLSSDYLLNNLGLNPNTTQKRLGDGFYEQRLIREQVAQLTGYRYLDGYTSDEAQYAALMNAGVTFAQQYGLKPGVALTAAQMAQLTSDIVWLVEQEVTLADGSAQRVLVPQVYVRVREGDIDGSGALLSGSSVDMRFAGDLTNASGTIAGRNAVVISADNIHNLGGRITGQDVAVIAQTDLNVIGGTIDAANSLSAIAGRDINIVTTTRDSRSSTGMLPYSDAASGVDLSAVTLDRVAGLYVTNPGGSLMAVAGRDITLAGAEVKSAGDASLSAGRDMNLDSVTTGRSEDIRWSEKNAREGLQSQEIGSIVSGAGNVSLQAGGDLTARAATLSAGETLSLDAGDKLTLYAGENQASAETRHATKSGMSHYSLDADSQETTLARTTLNATDIKLRSGGDMTLGAIEANAESLGLQAGGKLSLLTQSTTSAMSQKENEGDAAFVSASGSGRVDEASQYNRFNVATLNIKADGGVTAQIGERDSLATLGQQPGMAWVNQLTSDPAFANSVEWQRVKEEHEKWAYHQSGMGPVAAAIVTLVVGVATAGAGTAVAGTAGTAATSTAAATAGTGMAGALGLSAGATTIAAGALQAGITAMASQATISLANNNGDLGAVFKELGSSDSIKNIVTAMVTAGVVEGLGSTVTMDVNGVATPLNQISAINGASGMQVLGRNLINGTARALVGTAIDGGSLGDNLTQSIATAFINTGAALSATAIGANTAPGSFANFAGHAIAGCAAGALRADSTGGCGAGALGAMLGEATMLMLNGDRTAEDILANGPAPGSLEVASLMSGLGVALAGGDANLIYIGAGAGANAAENNAVGQLQMLAQHSQRFGQSGWQALSAAGQAAILRCASSQWCASLPLMAAAVSYVNSAQFAANQPSLADQIPTGYGAGVVPVIEGSTSTPANLQQEGSSTATPGTALSNSGTPGYNAAEPWIGDTSTTVPNNAPLSDSIMMSQARWVPVNESMSPQARAYQTQITGVSGQAYVVNGVKFDGVSSDGTLIDAKGPGYGNFVSGNGQFVPWFSGEAALVDQAERQSRAANGTPVQWTVAEPSAARAMQNLLDSRGIKGINVVHVPPK